MLFDLNYCMAIAASPSLPPELNCTQIHILFECQKSNPEAPLLIFDKLAKRLISEFYSYEENCLGLIDIKGSTQINEDKFETEIYVFYFCSVVFYTKNLRHYDFKNI